MCQQIQYIMLNFTAQRMEVWWGKISTDKKAPQSDPIIGRLQASLKISLTDVNLWPSLERYSVEQEEEPSIATSCPYFKTGYQPVWLCGPQVLTVGTQTEFTNYWLTMGKGCFFPTYWSRRPVDRVSVYLDLNAKFCFTKQTALWKTIMQSCWITEEG